MSLFAVFAAINTLTSFVAMFFIFLNSRQRRVNIALSAMTLSVGLWQFFYLLWQISDNEAAAIRWCKNLIAWANFIAPTFLWLTALLINQYERYKKQIILAFAISSAFFILALATHDVSYLPLK